MSSRQARAVSAHTFSLSKGLLQRKRVSIGLPATQLPFGSVDKKGLIAVVDLQNWREQCGATDVRFTPI
jgi:hypothetical protein